MLAAAAVRLAAIEALCPTAALIAGSGYPTMARDKVFDCRSIALQELAENADYTPTIGVFTAEASDQTRGEASDAYDKDGKTVLEIVAELAIAGSDADGDFADAMAADDPGARLVLEALCAQVDYVLEYSEAGSIFRRIVRRVVSTEYQTFAVPQIGLRYQRVTIRKTCEARVQDFDVPAGQLPEPMGMLFSVLPGGSYARAKLAALAAYFNPDVYPPLEGVAVTAGTLSFGLPSED